MHGTPSTSPDKLFDTPNLARGVKLTLHERHGSTPITWRDVGGLDWSDFAIVLGAGGASGLSFEAGCLLALATDHRIRLGDACAIVGTSAGAIAGSLIALGFEAEDLAAVVNQVDHYLEPALTALGVRFEGDLPRLPNAVQLFRRPTVCSTATGVSLLVRRRFTATLINALRTGTFDLAHHLRFLHAVDWASLGTDLRVCAVRAPNGNRRVFTSSSGVSLIDAVTASCAIPGVMRPVEVDDEAYVDGGLISPTNGDVLSDLAGRLIVVVSPMSGRRSSSTVGRFSSAHARRRLDSEVRQLRRRHQVLVIEPADRLSAVVVDSPMDTANSRRILTAAFLGSSRSL